MTLTLETTAANGLPAKALGGRATRTALVGTGYIAETHLAALRVTPDVEIVAVCDVDAAKARRFAEKHRIGAAVDSVEALIRDVRPDAVHALVPPPLHRPVATQLLRQGIHVLLEKPMALTAADAAALAAVSGETGARLGVNHNFTFHPVFVRLMKDVAAGRIGAVQHAVFYNNNPLRQLTAGDFGNWMFGAPGNIILEQGPHPLSQLITLMGPVLESNSTPGGRHDLPGGRVFFDTWQASMRCTRGTAQFFMSFGREFPESFIHVTGQDGSIRVDLLNGSYVVLEKTRWPDFYESYLMGRGAAKGWSEASREAVAGYVLPLLKLQPRRDAFFSGMKGSIGGFHAALRSGSRLPVEASDGVSVLEACEQLTAPAVALFLKNPPAKLPELLQFTEPRPGEVAVLGASGFIGGHVVEQLVAAGKPVRILVRKPDVLGAHMRSPLVRFVKGSLDDTGAVESVIRGCDAVIHLASGGGDSYADFERTIVQGTRRVAELCIRHRVRRLLYTSTVAVYYFGEGTPITEDTPADATPEKRSHYARAKIESERELMRLNREKALPVVIFRPAVVVGLRGRPMHTGVGQWPKDTQCAGWGAGDTPIPFVLGDDVARAVVAGIEAPGIDGTSFNLSGDVAMSAREYVNAIQQITGRPVKFYPTPIWLTQTSDLFKWVVKVIIRKPENPFPSYRDLRTRAFESPLDCSRAKRLLNWKPCADRDEFIERGIRAAMKSGA